jgi:exosortase A
MALLVSPQARCAAVVAALWCVTLLIYRDTAAQMMALWGSSETFAHGYVVPLIALWLIWRQRVLLQRLARPMTPAPSALWFVAASALAWLLGEAANVNALRQFALVAMLVFLVPVAMGWSVARVLMFPLGFLFFAVPFGDFLLPVLMRWTADFTVLALRATGIPVYRDGLQLLIPSGTWSVVEACSGVRYLIASLMVGALFAYLHYRSTKRRWLFMLVALAVPIVANWLRAYMIVMIGHLSDNKLAVGVDHLIYGWVFFGVVIGLMFWIGSRWTEPESGPGDAPIVEIHSAAVGPATRTGKLLRLACVIMAAALVLLVPPAAVQRADAAVLTAVPRLMEPPRGDSFQVPHSDLKPWSPAFVGPAASFNTRYFVHDQPVGLYVGYYRNQRHGSKLVSSLNALVRSDDVRWAAHHTGVRVVSAKSGDISWKTTQVRQRASLSGEAAMTVWQVYWVDGAFEPGDVRAKLRGALQRLSGRGDDSAVIVLYTPQRKGVDSSAVLDSFVRQHFATVLVQLKATRDGD